MKNVIETSNNASYIRDENGKLLEHAKKGYRIQSTFLNFQRNMTKYLATRLLSSSMEKYAKDSKGLLSNFYVESMNIEEYARQRLDTHVIGRMVKL